MVADELGADAVVVELLDVTVDGDRVRFTVDFVTARPEAAELSDVSLFIDNTVPSPDATLLPSGFEWNDTEGIEVGRTFDEHGQPHRLTLRLAPTVEGLEQSVMGQSQVLAVASGPSRFAFDGDVAADGLRFAVASNACGASDPLVVIKSTPGRLVDLAAAPAMFAAPNDLIDDVAAATTRLNDLIATVITRADAIDDTSSLYGPLRAVVADPPWEGIIVFDASVTAMPAEMQGQSTVGIGAWSSPVVAMWFPASATARTEAGPDPFFAVLDARLPPADRPGAGDARLRLGVQNSAMTMFDLTCD